MKHNYFTNNFRLNGKQITSKEELLQYTKNELTEVHDFFTEWFDDNNFIMVQTSGSTGKPKNIKVKKEFMVNSALATAKYFELEDDDIHALLSLSPKYIAGKMMLVRAITSGWNIDVVEPCSNPFKTDKIYDVTALVPLQVHHSIKDLHKAKLVLVGGGKVSSPLQKKLQKLNNTKIFSTYGMTETVTHIAVKKLNHVNGITNYFEVLPNIKIQKDDRGCLVIDAPSISDEKVITNDIIKLIDDRHFCWIGRYDNIINSGGVKINPERVEEKLSNQIKKRFFIASQKDEALGQKVILVVEGKQHTKSKIDTTIFDFLDRYEKPKHIYYIDKFIETKTGKVNRKACLELV